MGKPISYYCIILNILAAQDDARGGQGRQLAARFFFSSLIHSVPHIPLTCDLAQAAKQT